MPGIFSRRDFLKQTGLTALPAMLPAIRSRPVKQAAAVSESERVFFINEGPFYRPMEYVAKLDAISKSMEIGRDSFGEGGTIDALTKKFAEITGKEAAVYLPTGTLANQLAISLLSGSNSKVFVQESSHVYRDEGDAAQTVFNRRLIPLAPGNHFFTVGQLMEAIAHLREGEAFPVGVGAISIETPVRRSDNRLVPLDEIRRISAYCRSNGYGLHLDGARLHFAAAYTNVSVREYASYFDTVYMCLYKYLGATGGAVLCGDKTLIDRVPHLVKVHGGSIFTNWPNAAMALSHLQGIDDRLQRTIQKSTELFGMLREISEIEITGFTDGTNARLLKVSPRLDLTKFKDSLRADYITTGVPQADGLIRMKVNETLLLQPNARILEAFRNAVRAATV